MGCTFAMCWMACAVRADCAGDCLADPNILVSIDDILQASVVVARALGFIGAVVRCVGVFTW
jgi:hypothetical protein